MARPRVRTTEYLERQREAQRAKRTLGARHGTDHTREQVEEILGGLDRCGSLKECGFTDWKPQAASQPFIDDIMDVLREYDEFLPLTLRQIYYRLIGKHPNKYEKGRPFEDKLGTAVMNLRRSRRVPMDAIRDDGGSKEIPHFWRNADHWLDAIRNSAKNARLDRQEGQKHLVFYCEAAGMVPQIANICEPYGIPVLSSGGFDSLTERHALAFSNARKNVEVLHIGDLDPAGVHVFVALAEDVSAFRERSSIFAIDFTRLAVTPDQVDAITDGEFRRPRLDTSPLAPYKGNGNPPAYPHDYTCQAEAIPPDELARIVQAAIDDRLDEGARDKVLRAEKRLHRELARRLK